MYKVKWLILWSLWAAKIVPQFTPEVRVSNGRIRGFYSTDGLYAAYVGIPYATVNRHYRFKEAGPEPLWEDVFDAIDENVVCTQRGKLVRILGQENCLIVNVFTPPDAISTSSLPVMVFIHGGGFFEGSGNPILYGPQFLVSKGVILVNINYRLNIQGFLCLGIKEAPGNAGLKDQVQALKWIKKNIAAFGGDPDNVTLFGESAGGASVSYHVLSPRSRGLFHKAVMQSGSSLATWAHQFNPVYMASLLARTMGFNTTDPHELYDFFMNKTDEELVETRVPRLEGNTIISELLYSPCTEQVIDGVEPFLTGYPYDEFSKGNFNKVPMMVGGNSEEGYFFVALENDTTLEKIEFKKSLPKNINFPNKNEKNAVAAKLQQLYMGGDNVTNETLVKLSKYYGESAMSFPSLMESEILAAHNDKPVYSYLFGYCGWRNIIRLILPKSFKGAPGATHADELGYIFMLNALPFRIPVETQMIDRMTTLWTNFAKYGNPTPVITETTPVRWEPLTSTAKNSLLIDEEIKMTPMWFTESLKYWRDVYSKYRRKK